MDSLTNEVRRMIRTSLEDDLKQYGIPVADFSCVVQWQIDMRRKYNPRIRADVMAPVKSNVVACATFKHRKTGAIISVSNIYFSEDEILQSDRPEMM
jgi:hypothetical protein